MHFDVQIKGNVIGERTLAISALIHKMITELYDRECGITVNWSLPKNIPSISTTRFLNVDPANQSPL